MAKCTHLGLWEDRGHGRPLEEQEVMAGPILHLLSALGKAALGALFA